MRLNHLTALITGGVLIVGAGTSWGQGAFGGALGPAVFAAADANNDAAVTRDEFRATFEKWFASWDKAKAGALTDDQVYAALIATPQNQQPNPEHVQAMVAALPEKAAVQPKRPRRVLVLARSAGYVHSSIPLAARTVEEMGKKTGAWATTITYDAADINDQNLRRYDAIFLASTTGHFLDDPNDAAATAARRKALLDFVRGGKGLAAIHAASDSYHRSAPAADRPAPAAAAPGAARPRGGSAATLTTQLIAQGDKDGDKKLTRSELVALADAWFDKMDTAKSGRLTQQNLGDQFGLAMASPPPGPLGPTGFPVQRPAKQLGPDSEVGTWPEFNKLIGGFFKFHWNDGQVIHYKIDEPNHPLNAPFKGLTDFQVIDETYTFGRNTYSRENLRVLTSVDYAKMSAEDKAKEQFPRTDGDYALSWIRREGKGRVFYEAHGHNEKVYAIKPLLAHVMYGIQYVLGDLPADDSPSVKGGTK